MIAKVFVVFLLVAFSSAIPDPEESGSSSREIDINTLPRDVQKYLSDQVAALPKDKTSVELKNPPRALQQAAGADDSQNRVAAAAARARRICRYTAYVDRRTGRIYVVARCRRV